MVKLILAPLLLIGLIWMLPFLAFASAYAARYAFNTANVHAALPAALTVVLVWELLCAGRGAHFSPLLKILRS
ncbi:hypothetical protein [Streptomyces sp. PA5.6]|uniref:hypothetical protein n=1 Tax=Streptomyces sp. PA5.6 TaxID=3035651 RepID=UPI0039048FCD